MLGLEICSVFSSFLNVCWETELGYSNFLSQHFTQWAIVAALCFIKGNKCILDIMGEKVGKLICFVKLETHSKSDLFLKVDLE